MRVWISALVVMTLTGCTGGTLPLAKDAPAPTTADALVRPPWEAYVKAGPGAENDVDLETLNGSQAAQAAQQPTVQTAQNVAATSPETKQTTKPGQVQIKAVALLPVTGGSAKGNAELTEAMRKILTNAGWPVLPKPQPDALTIRGHVSIDVAVAGQQMVHLLWQVETPAGKNLGDVKQDNAVPDGSLKGGWGQNAEFAAQGGADGIFKLIEKFR